MLRANSLEYNANDTKTKQCFPYPRLILHIPERTCKPTRIPNRPSFCLSRHTANHLEFCCVCVYRTMTTKYNEMIGRMDAYNAALTKRDEMKAEAHRLTVRLAQLKHERSTLTYTMPHCSVAGCRTKLRGKGFMCHNHHLRAVKARGNREPLASVKFIVKDNTTHCCGKKRVEIKLRHENINKQNHMCGFVY